MARQVIINLAVRFPKAKLEKKICIYEEDNMGRTKKTADADNETKLTKTTVNILPENMEKIKFLIEESGGQMTKAEIINKAIAGVPIICLGDRKSIAQCFFDIRNALNDGDMDRLSEEVEAACQLLNSLMDEIEGLNH